MNLSHSVAEILQNHVTFQLESIDRMYLNLYVPALQYEGGVVRFFHGHRGQPITSSALMSPMTKSFVAAIEHFAEEHQIPLIQFDKGQRKEEVMAEQLRHFDQEEGVVFLGRAQEKARVFRTEKRRNPQTGQRYPWIIRSTAMVNQYYWYCVDRDFGPFFLKFCSYFPYAAKLCVNGHEYAKRQLRQEGIPFYEKVIKVKADVAAFHIFFYIAGSSGLRAELSRALLRAMFILTLDSSARNFIIERGTKRNAQFS